MHTLPGMNAALKSPSCVPGGISGCMESLHRCYSGQLPATREQRPNNSVDLNAGYSHDVPFQQSLTPPQMPGDHMYPYGEQLNLLNTLKLCCIEVIHLVDILVS